MKFRRDRFKLLGVPSLVFLQYEVINHRPRLYYFWSASYTNRPLMKTSQSLLIVSLLLFANVSAAQMKPLGLQLDSLKALWPNGTLEVTEYTGDEIEDLFKGAPYKYEIPALELFGESVSASIEIDSSHHAIEATYWIRNRFARNRKAWCSKAVAFAKEHYGKEWKAPKWKPGGPPPPPDVPGMRSWRSPKGGSSYLIADPHSPITSFSVGLK